MLEDYGLNLPDHHYGPLFHTWLPNGEEDAITINTGDEYANLSVWFARFGQVRDGLIAFTYDKREVDISIMERQAVLEAGPLFGRLVLTNVTE